MISGHFYVGGGGTHPLDQDVRLDEMLTALRRICDEHGAKGKPIWDSESGLGPMESFYIGRPEVYGQWSHSGFMSRAPVPYRTGAAMIVRLALVHLWHDVRWYYYHNTNSYGNSWAIKDFDHTPLPAAVAYAQTNRLMKGARAAGRVEVKGGIFGYRFNVGDETVAAIWAVRLKPGESRTMSWPEGNVRLFDMFGNPIDQVDRLPITMSPSYIRGSEKSVDDALAAIIVASKIDTDVLPKAIEMDLTDPTRADPPRLGASSVADASDLETVRDGQVEQGPVWISQAGKGEHWIEYQWQKPVEVNRLQCAWPTDSLPDGYKVQWYDGVKWRTCWPGAGQWRTPAHRLEDFPLHYATVKTKRLRMVIRCDTDKPAKVTEFRAFYIPMLTPSLTEKQEVYNQSFQPDEHGFIRDWLVCGPFPTPGLRYETGKKVANWDYDFLVNHWIYGPTNPEATIQPYPGMKHSVTFPPVATAP